MSYTVNSFRIQKKKLHQDEHQCLIWSHADIWNTSSQWKTNQSLPSFYKLAIVAAAICRIYQFSVHPEHPTPRHINVGCLLNVHNVVGPWTWQVEEMADVSSIETWLNRAEVWGIGEGKSYHLYLLKYCDISPCVVVPLGESWPEYLCCRPTQSGQGISSTGGSCAPQDLSIVEYREGCCAIWDEHTLECIYLDQEKKSIEGERTFRRIQI